MCPEASGTLATYLLDLAMTTFGPFGGAILSGGPPWDRYPLYIDPCGGLKVGPWVKTIMPLNSGWIVASDVIVYDLLEFCRDIVTLQSDAFFAIHVHRGHGMLTGPWEADP